MSNREDRIVVRVSEAKKKRIKKRAESLDRTISAHMLYCFDQEQSIAEGRSVVVPKGVQQRPHTLDDWDGGNS